MHDAQLQCAISAISAISGRAANARSRASLVALLRRLHLHVSNCRCAREYARTRYTLARVHNG